MVRVRYGRTRGRPTLRCGPWGRRAGTGEPSPARCPKRTAAWNKAARNKAGRKAAVRPTPHTLALIAIPAAVVGIGSSLLLLLVSYLAGQVEHFLWNWLPHAAGTTGSAWYWILGVLTMTGLAVGLVVRYVPGHAGPDPATLGLVEPPMAPADPAGPAAHRRARAGRRGEPRPGEPDHRREHRAGLRLGARVATRVPPPVWAALAVGGTVGALFGTPVAAALILSEFAGGGAAPLWDRLFGPLVAAGAGSLTTLAFANPTLALNLPPYPGLRAIDLLSGTVIAVCAVVLGLLLIEGSGGPTGCSAGCGRRCCG